jgi:hypothetical protein
VGNRPSTYLSTYCGLRVPYETGEVIAEIYGDQTRLPAAQVFPKGTRPAAGSSAASSGMHKHSTLTGTTGNPMITPGDEALSARVGGAPILAVNETAATSATNLVVTATRVDGTTVDLPVTLGSATQYAQTVVGAAPVNTGGAAKGQKTIAINGSTAGYKVGEPVLIFDADATQEVRVVASIVANTSITLEANLFNDYIAGDSVMPMFTGVAWKSGSVADTKVISLYARPDRTIAL